jgi:hypothetical protein
MLIVYVALGLLAVAFCVLAAMVGELARRVLNPAELGRSADLPELKAIEGINLDAWVSTVPTPLGSTSPDPIEAPADFGLVVLTTICTSCFAFARDLSASPKANKLPKPLFILISAPTREKAEKFATDTGLRRLPSVTLLFDELGQWCHQNIGLNVAPSFLRIIDAHIQGAWTLSGFADIPVLWEPARQVPASTVPDAS